MKSVPRFTSHAFVGVWQNLIIVQQNTPLKSVTTEPTSPVLTPILTACWISIYSHIQPSTSNRPVARIPGGGCVRVTVDLIPFLYSSLSSSLPLPSFLLLLPPLWSLPLPPPCPLSLSSYSALKRGVRSPPLGKFWNSTFLQVSFSAFSDKENWFLVQGFVMRNNLKLN
jgi:hypothetical protein